MSDNRHDYTVDKIIHEQVRLAILTYIASSDSRDVPFTELKQSLDLTAGNLSVQLRNLEEAGYVTISKTIEGRKPSTTVALTIAGRDALLSYITKMESIIKTLKTVEENQE